ncbi:MAG: carboxypeptidase-like regulatory domain-containing protein, partial [Bacteroidota bacterium]|nr:carboxypeptidase-like regulatory domain-containing protein [Bacteroidota bacterium]
MGKYFGFILLFFSWMGCINAQNTISGRITDDTSILPNVHVVNITSGLKTSSNNEGWYRILAKPKDELQYTYIGMDTVSILVEDVTKILNIKMNLRVEQLDEVVVEQKISKQKRLAMTYITDSSVVNTSFGYISPATVAYHLKV